MHDRSPWFLVPRILAESHYKHAQTVQNSDTCPLTQCDRWQRGQKLSHPFSLNHAVRSLDNQRRAGWRTAARLSSSYCRPRAMISAIA
jgi:hypothetical protein